MGGRGGMKRGVRSRGGGDVVEEETLFYKERVEWGFLGIMLSNISWVARLTTISLSKERFYNQIISPRILTKSKERMVHINHSPPLLILV